MPGMNSGVNVNDPTVVAAFKQALVHQGLIGLAIFAVLALAWVSVREWQPASVKAELASRAADRSVTAEPAARRLLRIGFGILWLVDGILQAQPSMAVGMPSQVIEPTAAASPSWVQHLVNWAGTGWSYHPIQAAAATVWIQVGIGIWLLLAARGRLSQLAGLAGCAWGLAVWVFGESLGGLLAPGLSWLTGAPGAAAFYIVAGALVALPGRFWRSPVTGKRMLWCLGVFLAGLAVLQAWPGRGFWQGSLRGQPGTLTAAVQANASMSQPSAFSAMLSWFASLVRAHGFAVNLFAVVALAVLAAAFLTTRPRVVRPALIALGVLCLADWVLVQDLGFLGGMGTDPNSMIPMLLVAVAAYLALVQPAAAASEETGPVLEGAESAAGWRQRLRPALASRALAAASLGSVASIGALAVVLLGAVPLAAAQTSRNASAILAESIDGSSAPLDSTAPGFALTDQDGRHVSLASLHGKAVLLTFLDPVCVTDCPLIGQEFREAGALLHGQAGRVELVAVNVNPLYRAVAYLRAFDQEESLTNVPDWLYLTGTPAQLQPVWKAYGIASETLPAGAMVGHSDAAFVIDPDGKLAEELDFDPGPGTAATVSSFATELATAARQALAQS